jgi:hypothetical protein
LRRQRAGLRAVVVAERVGNEPRLPRRSLVPATVIQSRRRELAHRAGDGIDVYLFWNPSDDVLAVTVLDEAGESFELVVDVHEALEVFEHPYAYAAYRGAAGVTIPA